MFRDFLLETRLIQHEMSLQTLHSCLVQRNRQERRLGRCKQMKSFNAKGRSKIRIREGGAARALCKTGTHEVTRQEMRQFRRLLHDIHNHMGYEACYC